MTGHYFLCTKIDDECEQRVFKAKNLDAVRKFIIEKEGNPLGDDPADVDMVYEITRIGCIVVDD